MAKLEHDLVDSVNDAAKTGSAITLTFVATCSYLGITASAITDKQLLLGTRINLPLLQTEVPLTAFYLLAPALLVVFHLYLLLEQYFLTLKIKQLPDRIGEKEAALFSPSPLGNMLLGDDHDHKAPIHLLLRLVFLAISSVLPIGVLLVIQLSFLPYHDAWVSSWHQLLVLVDLGMVLYFFFRAFARRSRPILLVSWRGFLAGTFCLIVVLLSSFLLVPGSNGYEYRMRKTFPLAGFFHRNISLPEQILVRQEPPAELLAAYVIKDQVPDSAWPRHAEGISLAGRDLRGADFTKAVLVKADFKGADLTGAHLSGADFRGAQFSLASLEGADLSFSGLSNASLKHTNLRFSNLKDARLEGADLTEADLAGAWLDRAAMLGAELSRSHFNRASARDTDLTAANLADSSLVGTDFTRAKLYGADLSRTQSKRTRFLEAKLQGVDFRDAVILGADFRYAFFDGTRGLQLLAVDLRGAFLAGVDLCGAPPVPTPEIVDFRDVDLSTQEPTNWIDLETSVTRYLEEGAIRKAAYLRLQHPSKQTCLWGSATYRPAAILRRKVLFHTDQRQGLLKNWPEPDITEREFQMALSEALLKEACTDGDLLEVILTEAEGGYTPANSALAVELARRLQDRNEASCPMLKRIPKQRRETLTEIAHIEPFHIEPGAKAADLPP